MCGSDGAGSLERLHFALEVPKLFDAALGRRVRRESRPTMPDLIGMMKKAFISASPRMSSFGTLSISPEIFRSAEASADGFPVMAAAPRSAAYSRYRESARMSR